ncbi:MAG TPA: PKD domain-containing protein [Anaerolineales bacterium]|nr:PKD domain-containing protein [Anaerolineales bacterium]
MKNYPRLLSKINRNLLWQGLSCLLVLALLLAASSVSAQETTPGVWSYLGGQPGANLGSTLASAGDVNGDGYADILLGAYLYESSNFLQAEGTAYLFYGSAAGLGPQPGWAKNGGTSFAYYGWAVASAGMLNGDVYSDVAVSSVICTANDKSAGAVDVFQGSAAGLSLTATPRLISSQANACFGYALAKAGDVNGDGFGDFLIGAPYYDDEFVDEGAVYLYYGSASGLSTTPARTFYGGQANARLGTALTAGNLNGDPHSDIVLAAPGWSNGQSGEGQVTIYFGGPGGPSAVPDWTNEINQIGAQYGSSVAVAGDINGGGIDDLLVGADHFDGTLGDEGKVFLYYGAASGPSTTPDWSFSSGNLDAHLGNSVASAGDINGDSFADLILGAWRYTDPEAVEGAVLVFFGAAAGPAAIPDWTHQLNQPNANLGWAVAGAGDINNDNFGDIIVGAPGYESGSGADEGLAKVFFGEGTGLSEPPLSYTLTPNPANEGSSVTLLGSFTVADPLANFTLTVSWGDGSPSTVVALGTGRFFDEQHTYSDNGLFSVEISVSDGATSLGDVAVLTVNNVVPTVALTGAASVVEGASYTLTIGPKVDPGADTLSACQLDWGDGSPLQDCLGALGGTRTHVFGDGPASHTVRIHLTDEDGNYQDVDTLPVSVTNASPVAVNDAYSVPFNQTAVISAPGVLENDSDVPADTLTAQIVSDVTVGTLALQASGGFTYTPPTNFSGTATFTYQVQDDDGATSAVATVTLTVSSNIPIVAHAGPDQTVNEGAAVQFAGSFEDPDLPGPLPPGNISWDFGDGTPELTGSLTPVHTYADNGIYTATLTLDDGQGAVDSDTVLITVLNVAPVVNLGTDTYIDLGAVFTRQGTFTDPGADTWNATVNYGDGSGSQPLALTGQAFSLSHAYPNAGTYLITVTVADDDGGVGTASINLLVGDHYLYVPLVQNP